MNAESIRMILYLCLHFLSPYCKVRLGLGLGGVPTWSSSRNCHHSALGD